MPARKTNWDGLPTREEIERSLARKIRIWAETWRRCPRKGCRRAGECQNFDHCAGVPREPVEYSEAERRAFSTALKKALAQVRGAPDNAGGYDPDARERDRPMPPAPPRIAPPSRPGAAEPPAPDDDPGSASRNPEP